MATSSYVLLSLCVLASVNIFSCEQATVAPVEPEVDDEVRIHPKFLQTNPPLRIHPKYREKKLGEVNPALVCDNRQAELSPGVHFFGEYGDRKSFIRYSTEPKDYETKAEYVFLFYAVAKNGLIMNALTKSKFDYESIFLKDGHLHYLFNSGGGNLLLKSKLPLNDGMWHNVKATRDVKEGKLIIDGVEHATGTSPGSATKIGSLTKVYFGGFPNPDTLPAHIPSVERFCGAINVIKPRNPNGGAFNTPDSVENITPAFRKGLQAGIGFGKHGGYTMKSNIREIGNDFTISMKFTSNRNGGQLFYAKRIHDNTWDGLEIFITKDGNVTAVADNGGGEFAVSVSPTKPICDGKSKEVIVKKTGTTLFISVADKMAAVESENKKVKGANSGKEPFYFGGIPDILQPQGYIDFTGCIEEIKIRGEDMDPTYKTMTGHVYHGCPKKE